MRLRAASSSSMRSDSAVHRFVFLIWDAGGIFRFYYFPAYDIILWSLFPCCSLYTATRFYIQLQPPINVMYTLWDHTRALCYFIRKRRTIRSILGGQHCNNSIITGHKYALSEFQGKLFFVVIFFL